MDYSLVEGLAALGSYGIILIVNNTLCDLTKNMALSKDEAENVFVFFLNLLSIIGIAYLAGFLGYIIINSEVVIVENLKLFVTIALIITIVITHFDVFNKITSSFIREKDRNNRFIPFVCAFWSVVFSLFMLSPSVLRATAMLSIQFLPVISKYIIPRLCVFQKS